MPSQTVNGDLNGLLGDVRFIPLSYDSTDPDSARKLVLALRPEWEAADAQLDFVRFTDGITNTLLKAINRGRGRSDDEADGDAILLRAYGNGTDVLIDRHRETQNHELLEKFGLAPELLARFRNGMMYRYIRGRPTAPADLRTPPIYRAVARRLAQWHATVPCIHERQPQSQPLKNGVNGSGNGTGINDCDSNHPHISIDDVAPGKPPPNVWTVMQKWILALPTKTDAQRTRQANLQKELTRLVAELSQRPGLGVNGLVFAHCDLLCGNVIVEPKKEQADEVASVSSSTQPGQEREEEKVCVNFIDYEYATPSPAAFDIANHFAEWGGFDCDFGALPTRAQRTEFIREYIRTYFRLLPSKSRRNGGTSVNNDENKRSDGEQNDTEQEEQSEDVDEEVEARKLMHEVDVFRGVPGFYWGIWALIQATISQIDFDYASYAEIRLGEYWAWRDEEDGSRKARGAEMPLRERRWAQDK